MPRLVHLDKMPSRKERRPRHALPPWQPGQSARLILEILYRYRYLTSELMGIVYEHDRGRGASQVRHHLRQLFDYGLIERFHRPAERGSTQYVYTLSVEGAHLVVPDEDWPLERRRIYNRARGRHDYEHLLAVSLLQVLWDLGSPLLEDAFRTAAYWVDKDGDAEHVRNSFTVRVEGKAVTLRPDTTAVILQRRDGQVFYRPVFFEIERTHKNLERTRQRFLAYHALLTDQHAVVSKVVKKELGQVPLNAQLVFVAAHHDHALSLWRTARTCLGLDGRGRNQVPDIWFVPLTSLFERDATGAERIIPPPALFQREIAFNLESHRETDAPTRWGRLIV